MIGNRVRVILESGSRDSGVRVPFASDVQQTSIEGILHKLDSAGATIFATHGPKEGQTNHFIPMWRIVEVVDLGRPI